MSVMDWKKETKSNPVYPVGTYYVRLEGWERVQSKPSTKNPQGTPQIRWQTVILQPNEHEGRKFFDHTALTTAALWRVANMVAGFGVIVDGVMDTDSPVFEQVCQACVGRTAYWRNEEGMDLNQNPKNNVVAFINDNEQAPLAFDANGDVPDFAK